jgi:hypothetical protein
METVLLDGELLGFSDRQEDAGCPSSPPLFRKKAADFISAFLYAGGDIEDASFRFSHHLEGCLLWIKERLESFGVVCHVKNIFKGAAGRPAVWILESEPYIELSRYEKEWFFKSRGKKRRKLPEFEGTPTTLFFWYLWHGRLYEYKQFRSNECPQFISKGITIDKSDKIAAILGHADISYFTKGSSGFCIKEPDYEKFFTYICKTPYPIPECFYNKFPPEYIRYNKDWLTLEQSDPE